MWWSHYQRLVRLIVLAVAVLFSASSFAITVPAYNGRMNNAVGGVIQAKQSRWGFAANDPRVVATSSGVASGLTVVAVGVATGATVTVGWPALLVGAGISALVTGGVSLAQDSFFKWLFNTDGTISTTGSAPPPANPATDKYPALVGGGASWYQIGYGGSVWTGGSSHAVMDSYTTAHYGEDLDRFEYNGTSSWGDGYSVYLKSRPGVIWENGGAQRFTSEPPGTCGPGQVFQKVGSAAGACVNAPKYVPPAPTELSNATVDAAVAALPSSSSGEPISDHLLALAANAAWKQMNDPNGMPWSASDPITPQDVAQWKAANPSAVPTVGDFVGPVSATSPSSGGQVSVGPAATSTSPAPAPGPAPTEGTGDKVDLGPDPNIGAPTLEAPPTGSQILAPIFGLLPDFKTFQVPGHASTCPTAAFSALGKDYVISAHCGLIEDQRNLIGVVMVLVWTLAGIFIVLRA